MIDEPNQQIDDELLLKIKGERCRQALVQVPDLMIHVRSLATDGRTERGETLPEWSAPMRLTAVDDSDQLYVELINWVSYWAETLEVDPPSTTVIAWSNMREAQGFRAATTPEGAGMLTNLQALWLLMKQEQILGVEHAARYLDDLTTAIWRIRSRYPTAPRTRNVIPRECTVCGEHAVGAVWNSENEADVTVGCDHCGREIPITSFMDITAWI